MRGRPSLPDESLDDHEQLLYGSTLVPPLSSDVFLHPLSNPVALFSLALVAMPNDTFCVNHVATCCAFVCRCGAWCLDLPH